MKMKFQWVLALCAGLVLAACSGGSDKNEDAGKQDTTSVTTKNEEIKGKYGLKSGILFMKSKTMGMTQDLVMYFDNYGAKQMTEITVEVMGMKSQSIALQEGDYVYTIDLNSKTGTKTKVDKDGPDNINFQQITNEVSKKFSIKKDGTAEFLGRTCEKYTMDFAAGRMKGTYYIWKGIPMKTEASLSGIDVTMEVTRIDENVAVAAEKFKVPEGIKITEVSAKK